MRRVSYVMFRMLVGAWLIFGLFAASPQGPALAQVRPAVPGPNTLAVLIKTTLVALNHANLTGNYTVLRDLGAPGFRRANTSARLAAAFRNLRAQRLDFGSAMLLQPKLTGKPRIDARNMLRVNGTFPSRPLRVKFSLVFQPVAGRWRLFGISVNTVRPGATIKP